VIEKSGDDAYTIAIKVRVGPISMTYRGNVEIVERDDANHRAVMRARARETRGQGTADARVDLSLVQEGATTKGTMVADVQLAGRAAAMGRGVIQDVSAKLVSTFAQNLEQMLGAGAGAPAEQAAPATETAPATATAPEAPAADAAPEPVAAPATGAEAGGGPEGAPATTPPPPAAAASAPTPPPPPRPAPAPAEDAALPVGQIIGSVLLARLKDPKVLGGIGAVAAFLAAVKWRRNR
jgi:carbon monoxide dehydrogenase subunit G